MHHEQKQQIQTVTQQHLVTIKGGLEIGYGQIAHGSTHNDQPKVT